MRYESRRSVPAWVAFLACKVAVVTVIGVAQLAGQTASAQTPPGQTPPPPPSPAPATPAAPVATPAPAAPAPAPVAAPVAQTPVPIAELPPDVLGPITRMSQVIESSEKALQQVREIEGELQRLRSEVERVIYESTASAEAIRPQLADVKSQIEKLGPPPKADQPPEPPAVIAERTRLNALAGQLDGALKSTELAWVRAKQLIDRITVIRYQLFTRNLLERRESPVTPSVWRGVRDRFDSIVDRLRYYVADWMGWAARKSAPLTGLLLAVAAVFAGGTLLSRRAVNRMLARPAVTPSFFERAVHGAFTAPLRALPAIIAAITLYMGLDALDLLYVPWNGPAGVLLRGAVILAVSSALINAMLAPGMPAWRLIPFDDGAARKIALLLQAFVAVYVVDTLVTEFGRLLYVPLVITIAQSFIASLVFFALLVALLLVRFDPQHGPDRPVNGYVHIDGRVTRRRDPLWVKIPLIFVALAILGSSVLGYIALGRFIAHQLVLSGMILAAIGVGYLAIRALTRERPDGKFPLSHALEHRFSLEPTRTRQLSRLLEFTGTLLLITLTAPLLLLQWGFSSSDIRDWFYALLFGFEIGQFRISLVRIILGVGLFVGLLFTTRMIQRWLRESMLAQPKMDPGIANSVDTAVGYAGTALAGLLAVSYAGFDITSLAIVAGALSVGIGFGLQSIVNNFVSGLILLVERPIKVGDWIVVGSEQGNVRRISVRSTEIETFDRASVILPNSELIAGRVINWTHRNNFGRIVLKVTLPPEADPDRVIALLKRAADQHPLVIQHPEPNASLDSFSTSGLDFSVRATLADVNRSGQVQSDLRIAIFKSLREAGLLPQKGEPFKPAGDRPHEQVGPPVGFAAADA